MPLPCGHSWDSPPVAGCGICLIRHIPFHRQRWGGAGAPEFPRAEAAKALPPCTFIGPDVPAARVVALGLNPLRRWTACEHTDKPLGEVVCGCQGCGPQCLGYAADA